MPVLEEAYPDVEQRILAILEWYGQGYGNWYEYPYHEEEAANILDEFPVETVIAVIEKHALNNHQLEGAARCFVAGNKFQSRDRNWVGRGVKLPSASVKQKLLVHCLSTGDHQKIVLGRRAFDDETMEQLAFADADEGVHQVIASYQRFSFKIFEQIRANQNVFVSPLSIGLALALVYNGAAGETQRAIASVLEYPNMSLPDFNRAQHLLQLMLTIRDTSFQLNIANALWLKEGVPFEAAFLERNRKFYHAEIGSLDFAAPSAIGVINQWVERHTAGKISKIVEYLDPLAMMVLLNTLYFEANWSTVFDRENTFEGPFTCSDGSQKPAHMMKQYGYRQYFANDEFEAVCLPYGEGNVSMYLFLPAQHLGLQAFCEQLSPDNWTTWMAQFQSQYGILTMPRFKFEYSIELASVLSKLGMSIAFDSTQADFKAVCSQLSPLWLNRIQHKTFVQVDEEGTKAAAATFAFYAGGSPTATFSMVVDRPFFFAIQDEKTGTILFMGSVVDPVW